MAHLDVNPMISALRTMPEQFEFSGGYLTHIPSQHNFRFHSGGRVQVEAMCRCASLMISSVQEAELCSAFRDWQRDYWTPILINQEFASHFAPPSPVRRALLNLTAWIHRRLLQTPHPHHHGEPIAATE
jgi:hypothetical protein